jgi:hypothetical protein
MSDLAQPSAWEVWDYVLNADPQEAATDVPLRLPDGWEPFAVAMVGAQRVLMCRRLAADVEGAPAVGWMPA